MKALLALAVMAPPALADPLALVDYDAVIAANLDRAEAIGDDRRQIALPGGVFLIIGSDDALITTRDAEGALGCLMDRLARLNAAARICPGVMTPGQADGLDSAVAALIPVYAVGILPDPVAEAEVATGYELLVRSHLRGPAICDLSADAGFLLNFVNTEEGRGWLTETLATPRLPVAAPCF
jgi:hypothetical protein